ncbi:hypothetical protein V8F06_001518 [Rhypophila decipiens]
MKSSIVLSTLAILGTAIAAAIDPAVAEPAADTAPEALAPMKICYTYSDCSFCFFYERCCYKKYGSHPEDDGVCKCGTNGRGGHCF